MWRWLGPPTQLPWPGWDDRQQRPEAGCGRAESGNGSQHSPWGKGEATEEERGGLHGSFSPSSSDWGWGQGSGQRRGLPGMRRNNPHVSRVPDRRALLPYPCPALLTLASTPDLLRSGRMGLKVPQTEGLVDSLGCCSGQDPSAMRLWLRGWREGAGRGTTGRRTEGRPISVARGGLGWLPAWVLSPGLGSHWPHIPCGPQTGSSGGRVAFESEGWAAEAGEAQQVGGPWGRSQLLLPPGG